MSSESATAVFAADEKDESVAGGRLNRRKRNSFEADLPPHVQEMISQVDVRKAVKFVRTGQYLLKYRRWRRRRPLERFFELDFDALALKWLSPKRSGTRSLPLTTVTRILPGVSSSFWKRKRASSRGLGIEIVSSIRNLRIQCSSEEDWVLWLRGLLYAEQKAADKKRRERALDDIIVRFLCEKAGIVGDASFGFSDLIRLLTTIKLDCDIRYVEDVWNYFNPDGSDVLEVEESVALLEMLLMVAGVGSHFETYADTETSCMRRESFALFLQDIQHSDPQEVQQGLDFFDSLTLPFKREQGLTKLGFYFALTLAITDGTPLPSETRRNFNSWLSPIKASSPTPDHEALTSYWIKTALITSSDGALGGSIEDRLAKACLSNYRCIHLLVTEDENAVPVLEQGGTYITFEKALRVIHKSAFVNSVHVCILSIDMTCSQLPRSTVARMLEDVLGSALISKKEFETLRMPLRLSDLKKRFLVRARHADIHDIREGNEVDLLLRQHAQNYAASSLVSPRAADGISEINLIDTFRAPLAPLSPRPEEVSNSPRKKIPLSGELQRLNGCIVLRAKDPEQSLRGQQTTRDFAGSEVILCNGSSFRELIRQAPRETMQMYQRNLGLVYPAEGGRASSPDIVPTEPWCLGVHMVATAHACKGLTTLLTHARFLCNNNSGIVLKPLCIRSNFPAWDISRPPLAELRQIRESAIRITIKLLSGRQIPRPRLFDVADCVSPFVKCRIFGLPRDCATAVSHVVIKNGFDPVWTNIFTFDVCVPSLAIMVLEVQHFDSVKSELLAAAAAPVSLIRPGLRWIPLRDANLCSIPWSGLMVEIGIRAANLTSVLRRGESSGEILPNAPAAAPASSMMKGERRGHFSNENYLPSVTGADKERDEMTKTL